MKSLYLYICVPLSLMAAVSAYGAESGSEPAQLETVTITATEEKATGPVDGYKASLSATGTKTDTPLLQTPMSVQVISREVMDDQQVLKIEDAVKNISGVYLSHAPDGNTMDSFNIRGFDVDAYGSSYLDGVKDFSRSPSETAGLERIEVLKGPAAIMYGRIEPGGLINRVSKRPQAESLTTIEQQAGSYDFYRTTVDSTGAVSDDETLLYRVNLVYEDGDGYKDYTHNRRTYVAPQVSWQPNEATNIRAGLEYQNDDRSWALTYGTIGDDNGPVDIPIETNLHDKDDYYTDENTTSFVDWSHQANETWRVQQRVTYTARNSVAEGSWVNGTDATGDYERDYWGWDDEQEDALSTNLELLGKLETGSIQHTLLFGVDYVDQDYDSGGWAYGGTPAVLSNIHNPVYGSPYDQNYTVDEFWFTNQNLGSYIQDQMALLDDKLHILVGARYDDSTYNYHYAGSEFEANDDMLTWRGGVLYQLRPNLSVYTSYVEGFGLSNFDWTSGEVFDPQTSHQYEIGTKWEITPKLGFTVAMFELIKDNLTYTEPVTLITTLAGEATSTGIEMDLNGELAPGWDFIASYAYTDVTYTSSDTMQGERLYNVPRHGASLWSTYEIAGTGFEVGGGAIYRSSRLGTQRAWDPALYPYTMDAYTVLDLMAAYHFDLGKQAAKIQVNVNNATDERYYPASYGDKNRIAQGEPRMIMGSIQFSF